MSSLDQVVLDQAVRASVSGGKVKVVHNSKLVESQESKIRLSTSGILSVRFNSDWPRNESANAGKDYEVVACVDGGSNAMGSFSPFIQNDSVALLGVEAAGHSIDHDGEHRSTLTKGTPGVLQGLT